MNPQPNTIWATPPGTPQGSIWTWGLAQGSPAWIRIDQGSAGVSPLAVYSSGNVSQQAGWVYTVSSSGSAGYGDIPVSYQRYINGGGPVQSTALVVPGPGQGAPISLTPPSGGGGGGGLSGGGGISPAVLGAILTGQQVQAAAGQLVSTGGTTVAGAAAADDQAAGILMILQGATMALGIQGAGVAPTGTSGTQTLLYLLLGAGGLQQLATAVNTLDLVIQTKTVSAITATELGAAWAAFTSSLGSILSTIQVNQLVGALAGGGGVSTGTVFGILLAQQALNTFTSAIGGAAGTSVATNAAAVAKFVNAFPAFLSSLATNTLISQLVVN